RCPGAALIHRRGIVTVHLDGAPRQTGDAAELHVRVVVATDEQRADTVEYRRPGHGKGCASPGTLTNLGLKPIRRLTATTPGPVFPSTVRSRYGGRWPGPTERTRS